MQEPVFEVREICTRILGLAVVIDHDDLIRRVTGFARQAVEATGQQIDPIAHGDDNRDLLSFRQFSFDPIEIRAPVNRDMSSLLLPFQMPFQRETASLEHSRLTLNIISCRSQSAPPMIKHSRDVIDAVGLFDNTEEKIVVLGAIKLERNPPTCLMSSRRMSVKWQT